MPSAADLWIGGHGIERILPHVLGRLETLLDELKIETPILVRMTGCPNGCAALHGRARHGW